MTKFPFPGDDYTMSPSVTTFASGGFRGDLLQVGRRRLHLRDAGPRASWVRHGDALRRWDEDD